MVNKIKLLIRKWKLKRGWKKYIKTQDPEEILKVVHKYPEVFKK